MTDIPRAFGNTHKYSGVITSIGQRAPPQPQPPSGPPTQLQLAQGLAAAAATAAAAPTTISFRSPGRKAKIFNCGQRQQTKDGKSPKPPRVQDLWVKKQPLHVALPRVEPQPMTEQTMVPQPTTPESLKRGPLRGAPRVLPVRPKKRARDQSGPPACIGPFRTATTVGQPKGSEDGDRTTVLGRSLFWQGKPTTTAASPEVTDFSVAGTEDPGDQFQEKALRVYQQDEYQRYSQQGEGSGTVIATYLRIPIAADVVSIRAAASSSRLDLQITHQPRDNRIQKL